MGVSRHHDLGGPWPKQRLSRLVTYRRPVFGGGANVQVRVRHRVHPRQGPALYLQVDTVHA